MIEIRCPQLLTESPNRPFFHWSQRHRKVKRERSAVALMLSQVRTRPAFPLVVTFVREAPRAFDDDNLAASFKACRDQVADWLNLPNDRDPRVTWRYGQEKTPRKRAGTLIRLETRPAADSGRVTFGNRPIE
jgi:hypothetical protein